MHIRINNKRIKLFDFTWLLFLGVLPFEKSALTLYSNSTMGELISISLNAITLIGALIALFNIQNKAGKKVAQKYILFFVVLGITYLCAALVDQITITRFFSLVCLSGYCLFAILHYDSVDKLLRDMNKATLIVIVLSFLLYLKGENNVMYFENATSIVFKGIAANRNSYSEISLFYIATNFYIWYQDKKALLWRLVTTFLAVYTTFLTNGATSIICVCLLLLLLIGCHVKKLRRLYSFQVFGIIYIVIFCIIVLSQYSDFAILRYVLEIFEKSTTLTGRTDIWRSTIESIFHSPLFGFGYDTSELYSKGIIVNDPHNGLLYIALTQGIIGIVAFISMLLFIIKNNHGKAENNNAYMVMFAFVLVWLIKGLVESVFSYAHFVFWCALIIMELCVTAGEKSHE